MAVVRGIFGMAAEGTALRAIKLILEAENIPTPKGAKFWDRSFFRRCILDDIGITTVRWTLFRYATATSFAMRSS
jgi:hypothetical protein